MKPYGVLGASFYKPVVTVPPDEGPCDLCEAHRQAREALPDHVVCPLCGADVGAFWADAPLGELTVVSDDNGKPESQRFAKILVARCDGCHKEIGYWPIPIIYNANHDVYYTGGSKYLASDEMRREIDAGLGQRVRGLVTQWFQQRAAGVPAGDPRPLLDESSLAIWIAYAAHEVLAKYLVDHGFVLPGPMKS